MSQLAKLAARIPERFIETTQGLAYASHATITQFLLYVLGPFSFELVQLHRGDVLERVNGRFTADSPVKLHNVVVGATYRLTAEVDGRRVVIEETGDVEQPDLWQHDGARLKQAESDALKRCAMRLGLGLELWAGDLYVLDKWLPVERASGNGAEPDRPSR